MIRKVTIRNFKKFAEAPYEVNTSTVSLFVGPNNGGKTTALQAISLWSFLIQKWNDAKGKASKSKAKKRSGAPVTRNEIYAVPVQEMKFLWFNAITQSAKQQKVKIQIIVNGTDRADKEWGYGVELDYGNPELAYCRPLDTEKEIPPDANNVFHLPPLSGVQTQERKIELGAQRHIIGEGRPGEILRNLLLQVQEKGEWKQLNEQIYDMFHVQLEPISFNPKTDACILVYYRLESEKRVLLEVANGGSGFLQFLLLSAFMYVHENSILLIDEPDSHMHVRLQKSMYDWLQDIAQKKHIQLLVSTHSEVIINSTDTDYIYTFFGDIPKQVKGAKQQIIEALKEVSAVDILNAQDKKFILFAEGDNDLRLLKSWAKKLNHQTRTMLDDIFFIPTNNDQFNVARDKFKCLKIIEPTLIGFFIRDNVRRTGDIPPDLKVHYWPRKEIENYLIIPSLLERFVKKQNCFGELFVNSQAEAATQYLKDNLPPKVYKGPVNNDIDSKGSDFLEKFFSELKININKGDYWKIADLMQENEIHNDIKVILDDLGNVMEQIKPIAQPDAAAPGNGSIPCL